MELRKVEPETPEGFTKLAYECVGGSSFPITTLALKIRIAPKTLRSMKDGSFAKNDFEGVAATRPKFVRGAFFSLARFCDYFALDLESCALACGFPRECLNFTELKSREANLDLIPSIEEYARVGQILDMTGPISLREIGTIILRMRENGKFG